MDAFTQTGAYEVLFELAHGGMGAVYLARAVGGTVGVGGFERLVAIKRLHLHLSGQADSVQRFLDEAAVAARIHHANVVSIHQVGSDEAGHFLVQDYVEGDTLQGLVDHAVLRRRRLPPHVVLRVALDALAGLSAVHQAVDAEGRPLGILHRDVSAQNLLVGRDGVTRLADFGIAKHAQSSVVTDGQYLQGRVLYMPPEYLARRPVDQRFDVYGMGVTLHLALSGDVPWPDASDAQIVHHATTVGIPRLSECGLLIAPAIEAIVARACARDPAARFAGAREMQEAIEELGRHTGWIASHGEVAALVEELAGRELAARRAAVLRVRGAPGRAPGAGSGTTPRATVVTLPRAGEGPAGKTPRALGRPVLAAGALLTVLGVLGAGVLLGARRAERPPVSTSTAPPSPVVQTAAPAPTAPAPTGGGSVGAQARTGAPGPSSSPAPSSSPSPPSPPSPPTAAPSVVGPRHPPEPRPPALAAPPTLPATATPSAARAPTPPAAPAADDLKPIPGWNSTPAPPASPAPR